MHAKVIQLLFLICAFSKIRSYKILGVFPLNSKSHSNMFDGLMKGLAKHGHQVDVISHFELKNPPKNYRTIINLNGTGKPLTNSFTVHIAKQLKDETISFLAKNTGNEICKLMALENMQRFIKNPPDDYDLVITEAFTANCYIGFGHLLKVPVILVSTVITEFSWFSHIMGNPGSTAFSTNALLDAVLPATFFDRLKNAFIFHLSKYTFNKVTEEVQTETMQRYLSPDLPNIREVEKNVALMFTNSHHTLYAIRPLTTAVVPIGGIHLEDNDEKLTPELKKWMDESTHGVIYFNVGSMMLIESLPRDTLLTLYASFSKVAPLRVLMKIANKDKLPPGLPENILTSSWIPQIPVLRHNNTKIFITHGGLMGFQEAIYYGIPMIGIPFFFDQSSNTRMSVKKNIGIRLDFETLTETILSNAINTILTDPKYKEAALRESILFRDRPMSAINTANFWVEYIIRNGADSVRSPAIDLYWWQAELLDVYLFLMFSFITVLSLILFCLTIIIRILFIESKNPNNLKKNN